MAKVKARKLKVYQTQLGFYDTVVAAASKAAALRAWGTRQDLFSDGVAKEATDRRAIDAALVCPDTPLRRGIGTGDPFSLNPGLPRLPDLPKLKAKTKATAPAPVNPKPVARPPPPPDRSALKAAEQARKALDRQHRREEDEFRDRRAMLEADETAAKRRYDDAKAKADVALDRERQAYVKGGGKRDWAD